MKVNTRLAVIGASLLALGGGGLAAFSSALPAGAQTTPAPAVSTPAPAPAASTPAPAPAPSSTADPKGEEAPEAPGGPDTDTVQDQSGDQSGPKRIAGISKAGPRHSCTHQ